MIPPKLKAGDAVRVITPSSSLSMPWLNKELQEIANQRFKEMGLRISFGKHVHEINEFESSSIESRVQDLHDAFKDPDIKLVITVTGGFNSCEILPYLNYKLIKANPKILCGYSDITALQNAIYAKTGLVTYSSPHYFTFGDKKGIDYTREYFKKCLFENLPFKVNPSEKWSNDRWGNDQEHRNFVKNSGYFVINEGEAGGRILGSNLVTFHALSGTEYMPKFKKTLLFIEDDHEENVYTFNRALTSLTQRTDFKEVRGIVIGRFQPESKIGYQELMSIVNNNERLKSIPIIGGADFGHTTPQITFPIGGKARFSAYNKKVELEITEH